MSELIWIRVLCPLPITTLAELTACAPKNTFVRNGGVAFVGDEHGEKANVLEFVVNGAPEATAEESSVVGEEVQK